MGEEILLDDDNLEDFLEYDDTSDFNYEVINDDDDDDSSEDDDSDYSDSDETISIHSNETNESENDQSVNEEQVEIIEEENDENKNDDEQTINDDDSNDEEMKDETNTVTNDDEYVLPKRKTRGKRDFLNVDFDNKSYGTRRNYSMTQVRENKDNIHYKRAVNVMFTQMQAREGIKRFGEKAVAALVKEFKQLNEGAIPGKPVICPVDPKTLTVSEKKKALNAVTLIKEKRNGDIKGRACAIGSKQRRYLKEDESVASPTLSVDALFATLMIDADEGRDVATFDVPGAFLQPEMPEND